MGNKDKKRKRNSDHNPATPNGPTTTITAEKDNVNTFKPSAVFQPKGGRPWTLSVALPGSIIANAQSHDQKTFLAGQIGRALAVFCVDEVVVFNDNDSSSSSTDSTTVENGNGNGTTSNGTQDTYSAFTNPAHFLSHVLSFLETPPYLRKSLFSKHPNLKTAGTLPSLDMPHHLRANEWREYREGVVIEAPPATTQTTTSSTSSSSATPSQSIDTIDMTGSHVDVGIPNKIKSIKDVQLPLGTRVTVKLERGVHKFVEAVDPNEPRERAGYYWGYTVRQSKSLSTVLTECPYEGGYDFSVGTSERGEALADMLVAQKKKIEEGGGGGGISRFQHLLLVFGGVAGLEVAAENDADLKGMGIGKGNVGELFDAWVNVLPGQGSRTIRTEEAVWLGLMGTRGLIDERW